MQDLIGYIISSMVDNKNDVKLKVEEDDSTIKFIIKTNAKTRAKIIGKDGKIINTLRDYCKAVSRKFNKKVYIEVNES